MSSLRLLPLTALMGIAACDEIFGTVETHILTVEFSGTGHGSVSSEPAGLACGSHDAAPCEVEFASGTHVHVTVDPMAGHALEWWTLAPPDQATAVLFFDRDTTIMVSLDDLAYGETTIGPAGGSYVSRDGFLQVHVPEGGVSSEHAASIRLIPASQLGPEWANVVAQGVVRAYELTPAGLDLAAPAWITMTTDQQTFHGDGTVRIRLDPVYVSRNGAVQPLDSLRTTVWDVGSGQVATQGVIDQISTIVLLEPWSDLELVAEGIPASSLPEVEYDVHLTLTASASAAVHSASYYDFSLMLIEDNVWQGPLATTDGLTFTATLRYRCPPADWGIPDSYVRVHITALATLPGEAAVRPIILGIGRRVACG